MKSPQPLRFVMVILGGGALFAGGYIFGSSRREVGGTAPRVLVSRSAPVVSGDSKSGLPNNATAAEADVSGGGPPRSVAGVLAIIQATDPVDRMAQWTRMLQATDAEGLKVITKAFEELYRMGGTPRDEETSLLHFRQGQLLGSKSIESMVASGKPLGEHHLRAMKGWADANPQESKAWVEALPDSPTKQSLLENWFKGAVGGHPADAMQAFASLSPVIRERVQSTLINVLHRDQGAAGVIQWFDQVATRPDSGVALQPAFEKLTWMVGQLADSKPEAALSFLRDPAHAPYITPATFTTLMRNIAAKSPGQAVEVLGELARGTFTEPQIREALQQTARSAKGSDLNRLGEWLKANPSHPLYDLTTRYFVEQAAQEDPEAAAAWAKKISDASLRAEAGRYLAR
ncbi:MAG TPA: hypothetical protein VHM91_01925 [Verrucomicrobiales bacterium]|nr:hypothetical protein [Verrucomicrobiales bacterium]